MKSSTYASLATIVFLKHKDKISKSIASVIRTTDKLCNQLGFQNDLSHMTKYRIIKDLLQSKILAARETSKNKELRITKEIIDLL